MSKPTHIFSWMNPKIEIRDTAKYGKGVFAKEPLSKDETLFVMGGHILSIEDENNLGDGVDDKPIEISEDYSIGPRSPEDMPLMPQHYTNHSCNPNAGFKGQMFMVAMKEIQPGEEITFDYAMIIHSNPNSTCYFKMECGCGEPNCRKIIDEEGWKLPDLQKRYDGYFQWYLQEKINRLKGKE
jgi:hypothetical protein